MLLEGVLRVALFLFQETSHVPPKNIYNKPIRIHNSLDITDQPRSIILPRFFWGGIEGSV